MVLLTNDRYRELEDRERLLRALEEAGVDNWDGYDWALAILKDLEYEEND